jgi:DNA-directed RNA polymerase subunit RPC12/RpoP
MSIFFRCPACGVPITLSNEYAGLKARCKSCGHKLLVPGQQSDVEAEALPADDAPPRPARPAPAGGDPFAGLGSSGPIIIGPDRPRGDESLRLFLSIMGFLFFLCCLGPALFFRAFRLGRAAAGAQQRSR